MKKIMDRYNEVPVVKGLSAGGGLLIITASKKGTFTVMIVYPNKDKTVCYPLVGTEFQILTPDTGL